MTSSVRFSSRLSFCLIRLIRHSASLFLFLILPPPNPPPQDLIHAIYIVTFSPKSLLFFYSALSSPLPVSFSPTPCTFNISVAPSPSLSCSLFFIPGSTLPRSISLILIPSSYTFFQSVFDEWHFYSALTHALDQSMPES